MTIEATGLPVCVLMGGRFGDAVRLYRAISQEDPATMAKKIARYRAEGYSRFQLKDGVPRRENGFIKASTVPGLGLTPKLDVLGSRVVEITGA